MRVPAPFERSGTVREPDPARELPRCSRTPGQVPDAQNSQTHSRTPGTFQTLRTLDTFRNPRHVPDAQNSQTHSGAPGTSQTLRIPDAFNNLGHTQEPQPRSRIPDTFKNLRQVQESQTGSRIPDRFKNPRQVQESQTGSRTPGTFRTPDMLRTPRHRSRAPRSVQKKTLPTVRTASLAGGRSHFQKTNLEPTPSRRSRLGTRAWSHRPPGRSRSHRPWRIRPTESSPRADPR